ncbi:MAG: 3-deoxy-manno-octulosonate cytidylyltransferase [Proteobacteria bacterium]|nr:3-deoxy-manno-octulosonate cytidylyltransferase [Pseudomonadota bacterium]
MKVVAFIPARYGSSRLEGKPLADICGKTMVERVYERATAARLVDGVTVATDDKRIFEAVTAFGGSVVMTSTAHTSGTDRVGEAARSIEADIVVNIQGDEPLIEPDMIDAAIEPLIADSSIELATLKTRITEECEYVNPNAVKVVTDREGFALYFSRSPIPYSGSGLEGVGHETGVYKHIGLYVYRKEFLLRFTEMAPTGYERAERLEQLRALENGVRIKVVETEHNPLAVDTAEDLERVRAVIEAL